MGNFKCDNDCDCEWYKRCSCGVFKQIDLIYNWYWSHSQNGFYTYFSLQVVQTTCQNIINSECKTSIRTFCNSRQCQIRLKFLQCAKENKYVICYIWLLRTLCCDTLGHGFELHQCLWICLQVCGEKGAAAMLTIIQSVVVTPEVNLSCRQESMQVRIFILPTKERCNIYLIWPLENSRHTNSKFSLSLQSTVFDALVQTIIGQ